MASIVYQINKKTGVTYVYESVSFWDKKKQQSRAKRKCIGKLDPETNQLIPTTKRPPSKTKAKQGPIPFQKVARFFFGATFLFDQIAKKIGLDKDLKSCFPNTYKQILSIAYFLILEDKTPMSRFPRWAASHKHPHGDLIPSQRSSDLFASIREDSKTAFFRLQGLRRAEKEYWAYDTTSISSYSKCLSQVRYGYNKEHDPLPQINLALLFGETSQLPFYYRKLSGQTPDVKTIKKLLSDMNFLEFKKIKLVLDRGFYSRDNLNALFQNHFKFLIAGKLPLRFIQEALDPIRETIKSWSNYSPTYDLYALTQPIQWSYTQKHPYKEDTLQENRRMYLHLYYSSERALENEKTLNHLLVSLQDELEHGPRKPENEKRYSTYFEVKTTPARGAKVEAKDDAIEAAKKNYGYFALLSNDIKEPIKALETYRNKDLVEKAFGNLKERLNLRRLAVSSEQSLDGKLFVEFIALIILSYIKKEMQDTHLFKDMTMQELMDELDLIECFEVPGHQLQIGEITNKQIELYHQMGVEPPSSLH